MNISNEELSHSITSQINDLIKIAETEQASINHIKPHGALYNSAAKNMTIKIITS